MTKEWLRPQVRKSWLQASVDGWVNAFNAQEVAADSKLQNEEEIPIPNNYLLDQLAISKAKGRGQEAEEGDLEDQEGGPMVEVLDDESIKDGSQPTALQS